MSDAAKDALEITQLIDLLVLEHREEWKKEFLSIFNTYQSRIAAIELLKIEQIAFWEEKFNTGKPIGESFPIKSILAPLKDHIDTINRDWWSLIRRPVRKGNYSGDFDMKTYVENKKLEFTEDDWHRSLQLKDYFRKNNFYDKHGTEKWKIPRLEVSPRTNNQWMRDQWYKAMYLPGKDFSHSHYSKYTSKEIIDEIKRSFLIDTVTGENKWIKNFKNETVGYYKNLLQDEKNAWKKSFKDSIAQAKHRAVSAVHSILNNFDPRAHFENFKKEVGKTISNTLGELRTESMRMINDTVNDVIDGLHEMGTKFVNGAKAAVIDFAKKKAGAMIESAKGFIGPYAEKLIGIIPNSVKSYLTPFSNIIKRNLGSLASKLNLSLWGGSTQQVDVKAGSTARHVHIEAAKLRPKMFKDYVENLAEEWSNINLASGDLNLRNVVAIIAEDSGFVLHRNRALILSRESLFINRPYLESDVGGLYRSFVFFTRPNCNLFVDGQIPAELQAYPEFYSRCLLDPGLYSELCRDGAYKSVCWRLLSNYCKEISPIKLSESTREGIKNMHDKSQPLPGIPDVYDNFDITVTFMDNARGDISKLLYTLSRYKDLVGKQEWPMRPEYILYRALDYLMTMYVVTVDVNWNVISFGCAKNLIISEPPVHFSQHKVEGFSKLELLDDFTVTFKATSWRPDCPELYNTFNKLFNFDPQNIIDVRGGDGVTLMATERASRKTNGAIDEINMRQDLIAPPYIEANAEFSATMPYKGISEFVGLNPGFYRTMVKDTPTAGGTNIDTQGTPKIKFGFSGW